MDDKLSIIIDLTNGPHLILPDQRSHIDGTI